MKVVTRRLLLGSGIAVAVYILACLTLPFVVGYPLIYATPFTLFVSVKTNAAALRFAVAVGSGQERDFWRDLSVFAEEHGFDMSIGGGDRGPQSRPDAVYRRGDGLQFDVWRVDDTATITWYAEQGHSDAARAIGVTLPGAMPGFTLRSDR